MFNTPTRPTYVKIGVRQDHLHTNRNQSAATKEASPDDDRPEPATQYDTGYTTDHSPHGHKSVARSRVLPVVGKVPAYREVPHGSRDASADPAQVAAWFTGTDYGVAVTGVLAIDGDDLEQTFTCFGDDLLTGVQVQGNPDRMTFIFQQPPEPYGDGKHPGGEVKGSGYVVLPPSAHVSSACVACQKGPHGYLWTSDTLDLPTLPPPVAGWLDANVRRQGDHAEPSDEVPALWLTAGTPCQAVTTLTSSPRASLANGTSRHDAMTYTTLNLLRLGEQGHAGVGLTLAALQTDFTTAVKGDAAHPNPYGEFNRAVLGAAGIISSAPPTPPEDYGCCPGTQTGDTVISGDVVLHTDLTWILGGTPPPSEPPRYCTRADGNALFYPGRVNGLFGDPECGKTWIALTGAVEALTAPDSPGVAVIDVDHNGATDTVRRMLDLGAPPTLLADPDTFRYYAPQDGFELGAVFGEVCERRPGYVVLDSLGEVVPMFGKESKDNDGLTVVMRKITAMAEAGACVVTLDHLPKATEARTGGFAIGAMAKKRAMRGAYLRVDRITPFAQGQEGKARLTIEKDTTSGLRAVSPDSHAGTFILDSRPTTSIQLQDAPTVRTRIEMPTLDAGGHIKPTADMASCLQHLRRTPDDRQSTTSVRNGTDLSAPRARAALEALLLEGLVDREEKVVGARVDTTWKASGTWPTP